MSMLSKFRNWLRLLSDKHTADGKMDFLANRNSPKSLLKIDFLADIDKKSGTHLRQKLDEVSKPVDPGKEPNSEDAVDGLIPILPGVNQGGYDIIGDIHGHAMELEALLGKLGYAVKKGVWCHPTRKAIFVGDFIDKGPEHLALFEVVRNMVDSGSALAVMGNHEFNAICWATPDIHKPDAFLRPHTCKNYEQTKAFMDQVEEGSEEYKTMIKWFSKLPLFLDLPEFRVIHACWSDRDIAVLRPYLDRKNAILGDAWQLIANEDSAQFQSLEKILKGPEVELPEGISFNDVYGHERTKSRVQWWSKGPVTFKELSMVPHSEVHKIPDSEIEKPDWPQYTASKPVFFGHYTFRGEPRLIEENICCVDFSITDKTGEGKLCCYRWNVGDNKLSPEQLVWLPKIPR
jgi:hypothetical protein